MIPSRPVIASSKRRKPCRCSSRMRERDHAGDHPGGQQRHVEEQVETECGADELGDVGRHRHQLRLHPQSPGDRARVVVAAELGQVAVGDDAELRRQVLDQHRHHVREQHHPQEQVAELGAALDVGGEVARVDVGDRGHERRAEHPQRRPHTALREQLLERARLLLERDRKRRRPRSRPRAPAAQGEAAGVIASSSQSRASRAPASPRARAPHRRSERTAAPRTAACRSARNRRQARSRGRPGTAASPDRSRTHG